jgi:Fur family ferric uptake transcriptional regulator
MRNSSVDQLILKTLSMHSGHLTSLQVYEEIRAFLPAVNQSTIYRALERLAHQDRISVADIGTGAMVYELVTDERHHHIVCQECGHIITISGGDVQGFFEKVSGDNKFHIVTNHLILFGLCEGCRQEIEPAG